jgi:hypothetical protein
MRHEIWNYEKKWLRDAWYVLHDRKCFKYRVRCHFDSTQWHELKNIKNFEPRPYVHEICPHSWFFHLKVLFITPQGFSRSGWVGNHFKIIQWDRSNGIYFVRAKKVWNFDPKSFLINHKRVCIPWKDRRDFKIFMYLNISRWV